jgi:PAS domain S-box-containing protein
MNTMQRSTLRDLMRRVDEVRGLTDATDAPERPEPVSTEALVETLSDLVQELERSHRRLIETNVQLVSLREVASSVVSTFESEETTRIVTRYLCRAFGFDSGFLLLVDHETGRLEGAWTQLDQGKERAFEISLPLIGDHGALTRAMWLNRTVIHHAPPRHVVAVLPDGHALHDVLDELAGAVCVPLRRSQAVNTLAEPHELCGARCVLGDMGIMVPPPGSDAATWAFEREERQKACLACDLNPMLGVIGMARHRGSALAAGDVQQLESIAISIAPVVETARLAQDLRKSKRFREHVLDSMASALVAVGMQGQILTFNRAAEELLGFREVDVLGRPFGALLGSDGEALMADALESGREAVRVETVLRTHDGTPLPVRITTSLLRNDRRNIYGAIATFLDLTPIKRAEEHAQRLDARGPRALHLERRARDPQPADRDRRRHPVPGALAVGGGGAAREPRLHPA